MDLQIPIFLTFFANYNLFHQIKYVLLRNEVIAIYIYTQQNAKTLKFNLLYFITTLKRNEFKQFFFLIIFTTEI